MTVLCWKSIEIFLGVHVTVLRLHSRDSRRPYKLEDGEFSTKRIHCLEDCSGTPDTQV